MDAETPIGRAGPFRGVRDSVSLATQDMSRLAAMVNGYCAIPEIGDDMTCRPGFKGETLGSVTGVPVGITIAGPIYAALGYRHTDGVYYNLFLVGVTGGAGGVDLLQDSVTAALSAFVRWNPATGTYTWAMNTGGGGTKLLNAASSSRVFFTAFAGYVILSDGVNRLLKWTPSNIGTGTAVLTTTGTTDAVYGQPTVYAGKLFYIPLTSRNTIKWSNENDPGTGYTGAQAWDFTQTSSSPIASLYGTNNALLVFRTDSVTTIIGTANTDFRSASTVPSVNMAIGTKSPGSVCAVYEEVWFWDQFGRPQKVVPGQGVVPLWFNCNQQIAVTAPADTTEAGLFQCWVQHIRSLDVVIYRYARRAGGYALLVFHARTSEYWGTWTNTGSAANKYGAEFHDENDIPTLAIPFDTVAGPTPFDWNRQKQDYDTTAMKDELVGTIATQVPVSWTTPYMAADLDLTKEGFNLTVGTRRFLNTVATLNGVAMGSRGDQVTQVLSQAEPSANSRPGRAVLGLSSVMQTRWVQATLTGEGTETTKRPAIGEIRVYGKIGDIDYSAP